MPKLDDCTTASFFHSLLHPVVDPYMLCSASEGYLAKFGTLIASEDMTATIVSEALNVSSAAGTLSLRASSSNAVAFRAKFWGQGLNWLDEKQVRFLVPNYISCNPPFVTI